MSEALYSYPYAFIWYQNKNFETDFSIIDQFNAQVTEIKERKQMIEPGMISQAQAEELRFCEHNRDYLESALQDEICREIEIMDTPHMVWKIIVNHNMKLYITKEYNRSSKEEIYLAKKILTNQKIYDDFINNGYLHYNSNLEKAKCWIRITFADFSEAMDDYILKVPKRGDYTKSRLFAAICNIVETDQLPYFRKTFPQSFQPPLDDTKLHAHLKFTYNIAYGMHVD